MGQDRLQDRLPEYGPEALSNLTDDDLGELVINVSCQAAVRLFAQSREERQRRTQERQERV